MPEKFKPQEKMKTPETLPREVAELGANIDLLKDLVSVAGSLSISILKGVFKSI